MPGVGPSIVVIRRERRVSGVWGAGKRNGGDRVRGLGSASGRSGNSLLVISLAVIELAKMKQTHRIMNKKLTGMTREFHRVLPCLGGFRRQVTDEG